MALIKALQDANITVPELPKQSRFGSSLTVSSPAKRQVGIACENIYKLMGEVQKLKVDVEPGSQTSSPKQR